MLTLLQDLVQFTIPQIVFDQHIADLPFLHKCVLYSQLVEDHSMDVPFLGCDVFHVAKSGIPVADVFAPPAKVSHKTNKGTKHQFLNLNIVIVSDSTLNFKRNKKATKGLVQNALHEEVQGVIEITQSGNVLWNLRNVLNTHTFDRG